MLRVYIKPPGGSWVEYTPVLRPDRSFEIGGRAYNGEADQGEITVDDPDYTLDVYEELAGHREVKITEDASGSEIVLALGRIGPKSMARGAGKLGREVTLTVEDVNCELRGIIVNKQNRPEETGLDRVKALRLSHLNGSASTSSFARDSTEIDIDLFVPDADEVTMPAKFYGGVAPLDIIRECAEWEGKLFFVYTADNGDKELFYARPNDLTLHNCTLEISDDIADIDYTTVFPIAWVAGPALNMDPLETVTGVNFIHPDGQRTYGNDPAREAIHDKWEESMFVDEGPGALADSHHAAVLLARGVEEVRRQGAIQLPGSKVHLIKPGMLLHIIQANAAAVPNVTGGSQKYRIAQIRYKWLGPDADDDNQYYVIVTLEVVRKLWRRWGPGKPGAKSSPPTPTPAPEHEPDPADTVVKYYSGGTDDPGGDDPLWDGILENQGSAGQGALGSDAYMFKSAAPDKYQESFAATAGAQYRISGYVGCTSDGQLTFIFSSAASGTDGGALLTTILAEHTITPVQPGHEHAPEWTAFTAGPFTAPTGTNSAALGRTVGVDFDEVSIFAVDGGTVENDPHAVNYGDCPHESPHFLPSDFVLCRLGELEDSIPAVLDDLDDVAAPSPADGDVLTWDDDTDQWVPVAPTTGAGTFLTTTGGEQHNVSVISDAGAALELDLADGNVFEITLTEDCEISATGFTAGKWCEGAVLVHQDGTGGWVLIYDTPFEIPSGGSTLPTTADTTSGFGFGSLDGGTTIYWWALGSSGSSDPADDTSVWMPLTTRVGGDLVLVADGDDGGLIPTLVPLS